MKFAPRPWMKTPLSRQMPSVESVAKGCQFCCEEKSNTSKTTSVPDQQDAAVNAVVWDFAARALHAMVSRLAQSTPASTSSTPRKKCAATGPRLHDMRSNPPRAQNARRHCSRRGFILSNGNDRRNTKSVSKEASIPASATGIYASDAR